VTISVPADAHNGQVLSLEYGSQLSANRNTLGRLMITLLVKDTEGTVIPLTDKSLDRTLPVSDPHLHTGIGLPSKGGSSGHENRVPKTIAAVPPVPEQRSRRSRLSRGTAITTALIVLTLLVVSASIGVFSLYGINRPTSDNANTAATIHANDSTSFAATATTQSNNTQANATAQAITASATSQTNNANPTATAANTNTFPPAGATLVLNDPLTNNDNGYGWETTPDAGGVCQFTGGAYQVNERAYDTREYCPAYNTNFGSNFAYEVQMTIVQGDLAGLIFRDETNQVFYFWRFSQDGSYDLIPYHTPSLPTLVSGTAHSFNTGYNQSNLLQVIVTNSRIQFFVNNQYVTSVGISSYGQGYIGVFVKDRGNPTEAIFSNAKVWTF
jgi:3D (Asp-Asp-Asp) domain-containing protein